MSLFERVTGKKLGMYVWCVCLCLYLVASCSCACGLSRFESSCEDNMPLFERVTGRKLALAFLSSSSSFQLLLTCASPFLFSLALQI
jgi:hypothetical protein